MSGVIETMKSRVLLLLAAALLGAPGCGMPEENVTGDPPETPTPQPSVFEVTCTEDGDTEIKNLTVRVGPAGVEVRMSNLSGEPVSLNGVGWDFSEGDSTEVVPVPPGPVEVACWPYSKHRGREPSTTTVDLVDPESLWVDPELQCRGDVSMSIISDHFFASPGQKGDPVEIGRRALKGLHEDDVVELASYPEQKNPVVRVVRGGRTIANVGLDRSDEGGYLVGGADICGDSDIRFE